MLIWSDSTEKFWCKKWNFRNIPPMQKLNMMSRFLDQRLYEKISEKCSWYFGTVHVRTEVVGYFKIPLFARSEKSQFQPLGRAAPDPLEYSTQSYWMTFPNTILQQCPQEEWVAGLYSLGEAIKLATAIEELCAPPILMRLPMSAIPIRILLRFWYMMPFRVVWALPRPRLGSLSTF